MRRSLASAVACCALIAATLSTVVSHATPGAPFLVGAAKRDISPPANLVGPNGNFYLGGYGISAGAVGLGPTKTEVVPSLARHAIGTMGVASAAQPFPGGATSGEIANNPFKPFVRAFAAGDGAGNVVVMSDLDNQGTFASLKPNPNTGALRPWGLDDIRHDAAAALAAAHAADASIPAVASSNIVISSDHSHAGQDMTGVWGFVPDEYLKLVHDAARDAIVDAVSHMRRAELQASSIATPQTCIPGDPNRATRIFSDQFCGSPYLSTVDADVRVLRAFEVDADGARISRAPFAVLTNAAIHSTVGGSDNHFASSDWPNAVSSYMEEEFPGSTAVTIVGDVGRTQPNDRSCEVATDHPGEFYEPLSGLWVRYDADPRSDSNGQPHNDSCGISQFARRVQAWADRAMLDEQPVPNTGVAARNLFIHDPSHSAILFGLNYGGDPAGAPIARGLTPPYLSGTVLGTWVGVFRIGDIVLLSAPGEAYPNIRDGFLRSVISPGAKTWIFGLANDQLGYLIAPFPEGYPEPMRSSFFSGNQNDPTTWGVSPVDNDNYFFNVSHTIGDHVMCTMIKGALQLGIPVATIPTRCALWMQEPNISGPGDPNWSAPAP